MENRSRPFATVVPTPEGVKKRKRLEVPPQSPQLPPGCRVLRVSGTAELHEFADRASFGILVSSEKKTMDEAITSVSRRIDYILQCLRQHGVKDKDIQKYDLAIREEETQQYSMQTELNVTFSDFTKLDEVDRLLLDKVDDNVKVHSARYYHSNECLSLFRRRVCAAATENATQKARDMCQVMGQTLGPPLLVVEEELEEKLHETDLEDSFNYTTMTAF
uniref:Uncharacterized protein n=1 Tax=Knipowitschia caucasica TaxID=637954 RepID=A0AAV2KDM6_KNICA